MVEVVLSIVAFILLVALAVIEVVNYKHIHKLERTIDDLYFTVAEDRSEIYKELELIQHSYDVTQLELKLVAERCNIIDACDKCEGKCTNACKEEAVVQKPKRPRKPRT